MLWYRSHDWEKVILKSKAGKVKLGFYAEHVIEGDMK